VQGATGGLQTTGETSQEGDPHGVLFTCPHHAPTDPPEPPHHRYLAHDNDSHPKTCPNGNDTTTGPTTHHTSTTAAAACPRTQHMAHLPQLPQTRRLTQRGSTYNNDGHPATAYPGTQHMAQLPPPLPATESPHQHPPPVTVTTPARPTQGKCRRPPTPMPMPRSPDATAGP
jgi:hypothetical protein